MGSGAVLGQKRQFGVRNWRRFESAPPDLAPLPRAATGELEAQNLDLGRACVKAKDG